MNGDHGKIYDEIKELRQEQNDRHAENLVSFGKLQCTKHVERMKNIQTQVSGVFWGIGVIFAVGVGVVVRHLLG